MDKGNLWKLKIKTYLNGLIVSISGHRISEKQEDKVSPKLDLNKTSQSQLIHPSNPPRQPSLINHNAQAEMLCRYPHEKVQTPATSRPVPEVDYRGGVPGLVSPPLSSLARDYTNHTHQLYKQMVESAGRIWKPEERLRELGIQPNKVGYFNKPQN